MRNTIKLTLSTNSIQQAITELQAYKLEVIAKKNELARRLAERGVEVAKAQVYDLDAVFTTELFHSISSESQGVLNGNAIFVVKADSEHAIFVELGTGYEGEQSPYQFELPEGVDNWKYGDGKTIRHLTDGTYGWFYPTKDGKYIFTKGMPSRPFMHNTAMELYRITAEVAKEVFSA